MALLVQPTSVINGSSCSHTHTHTLARAHTHTLTDATTTVLYHTKLSLVEVSVGSPSHGGDVAVYVFDINQPSLPTPVYSVLVSISVFMAPSAVFRSINSSGNSLLSHSVLPVLFLPNWSFQLFISS